MNQHRYPFGQPVRACAPHRPTDPPAKVFVLGAYPSALHVRWTSPDGSKTIRALPVADEPEPFWDGHDEVERIEAWKALARIDPETHGSLAPVRAFNGSSGVSLQQHYLEPLGIDRTEAWITDCLDTYRASEGVAKAIDRTLLPILGEAAGSPDLPAHPSEAAIVREASDADRLAELRRQLASARAPLLVTLGNAASRVMAKVLQVQDPGPLDPKAYGVAVEHNDTVRWMRLAHPAAIRTIPRWTTAHEEWATSVKG